jgi:hypothetical protein
MHAQGTTGMHACMDLHTKAILHTCVFHGCRIDEWLYIQSSFGVYIYAYMHKYILKAACLPFDLLTDYPYA